VPFPAPEQRQESDAHPTTYSLPATIRNRTHPIYGLKNGLKRTSWGWIPVDLAGLMFRKFPYTSTAYGTLWISMEAALERVKGIESET
jgi:hypothetical protein